MTEIEIERFHDSFQRCMAAPDFFERFYDEFLGSSAEVRVKFRETDFAHQKRALKVSFLLVMDAAVRRQNDYSSLEEIALRHGRHAADIAPHLYDLWLEALIRTVEQCDVHFTPELDDLWRSGFRSAIDYLVSMY